MSERATGPALPSPRSDAAGPLHLGGLWSRLSGGLGHLAMRMWQRLFAPQTVERVMPQTLMGRASLTILVPLILVQIISTYVFFYNYRTAVSHRLEADLAGDLAAISFEFNASREADQRTRQMADAKRSMDVQVSFEPGAQLVDDNAVMTASDADDSLERTVWEALGRPFVIDRMRFRPEHLVSVRIQENEGILDVLVPRQRIFGSNSTLVFVIWMTGSSILLFGVATVYLRSQVAAVRRLARAADAFGKGREVADFPAEGAFEVRQAARAFNIMRDRIKRQIAQRTEMLAGVSHDLRTPLTRMKLQLAMMTGAGTEDVAAMRDDLDEMERMLEAYLAFARGDGAEAAVISNPAELLTELVGRFRREGAEIALDADTLPGRVALKPIAFGRCLGNLIANAVRYGRNIAVSAAYAEGFIHIHVDDDGPGIPPDKREEAFRAFHRLEPSRNTRTGGIGLGLTIARDLVRGMGGDVVLGTSPAGGLRASLRIPV